jgi:hypothetical protein
MKKSGKSGKSASNKKIQKEGKQQETACEGCDNVGETSYNSRRRSLSLVSFFCFCFIKD